MNPKSIDSAKDSDLRLSQHALRRAAQRARELASQTGTLIVISRDGVIEKIAPEPTHSTVGVQEAGAP
jgi:hypothetical protein